jgi:hypothetical protein
MRTFRESMSGGGVDGYENYLGTTDSIDDMYVFLSKSPQSDTLAVSNFDSALKRLKEECDGEGYAVHVFGHWLVGSIDAILVTEGTRAFELACEMEQAIENYPILDEDHYGELEDEKAWDTWNFFSEGERIEFIRDHANEMEFRDFSDLRNCVRGVDKPPAWLFND